MSLDGFDLEKVNPAEWAQPTWHPELSKLVWCRTPSYPSAGQPLSLVPPPYTVWAGMFIVAGTRHRLNNPRWCAACGQPIVPGTKVVKATLSEDLRLSGSWGSRTYTCRWLHEFKHCPEGSKKSAK